MRPLASSLLFVLLSSSLFASSGLLPSEALVSELAIDSAPFGRSGARIATNGDGFLVVWRDFRGIMATRLTADGDVVDPVGIPIDPAGTDAVDVVWAGSSYYVASGCAAKLQFQTAVCLSRIDVDGSVHRIPTRVEPATRPSLAWNGRELLLVAALSNFIGDSESLYAHRIAADGAVITGFIPIGRGFTSAVAAIGEDFLVVYSWQGLFGRVVRNGVPSIRVELAPPYDPHGLGYFDVAANGNEALVVWSNPDFGAWHSASVRALRVSREGMPLGAPALVGSEKQLNIYPSVSAAGAGYVVSWTAADPNNIGGGAVRAVRVSGSGSTGDPIELANASEIGGETAVAANGVHSVGVWTKFGGSVYDKSSVAQIRTAVFDSVPLKRETVSRSATWQETPAVASISGRPVVAWSEIRGDSQQRIVLVKSLSGTGAGEPVSPGSLNQKWPVISAGESSFVFWIEVATNDTEGSLYARRVGADGRRQGEAFRIADARDSSLAATQIGDLHYIFFSARSGRIALLRLRNDGTLFDTRPLEITTLGVDEIAHLDPSVSTDGNTMLLAWRASWVPPCTTLCVPYIGAHVAAISRDGVFIGAPVRLTFTTAGFAETVCMERL
jgi:hypothetical protein